MKLCTLLALAALSASTPLLAAGDAVAGQTKAAVCAACHGIDGNSSDPQYPKIAGQHADYLAHQLALFKTSVRNNPIMLGFSITLSEQDMADLGAYFASQAAKPDIADESLVRLAEPIWRGGDGKRGIPACAACHGPSGRGNPASRYPALAGQHAQYSAGMLRRFRDGELHGSDANGQAMAQLAKPLTDAEIDALASYLQGLDSASP
ncbi:MAG: cytochrome c4 [Xanthomonadales bacterium]|nr:Cytochrome c4 [Xanthomonadales bacterium]MCC6592161.1 cytochrome c4 [Xanthomonadales bacterium]MCE7931927.1 cytochrome c4 [Xanthomonadales bacterium PRO6]